MPDTEEWISDFDSNEVNSPTVGGATGGIGCRAKHEHTTLDPLNYRCCFR